MWKRQAEKPAYHPRHKKTHTPSAPNGKKKYCWHKNFVILLLENMFGQWQVLSTNTYCWRIFMNKDPHME